MSSAEDTCCSSVHVSASICQVTHLQPLLVTLQGLHARAATVAALGAAKMCTRVACLSSKRHLDNKKQLK